MKTDEYTGASDEEFQSTIDEDDSLKPNGPNERTVGKIHYMAMWIGNGMNMGNMTLGASIVVAGAATLNIWQALTAALISILIITVVFTFNDRPGYRLGIPYVVQLRMSFGYKGTVISSLLRGIPGAMWYGIQSWLGATALNEIIKILSNGAFDSIAICFVVLILFQIILSVKGFMAIKWVESVASIVIFASMVYVFITLMSNYKAELVENWVNIDGTWGLPFFGFIVIFLGNYAAIILNAADYSRELESGISDGKRSLLYFLPITISYGLILMVGAMVSTVTGITNPPSALTELLDNSYVTLGIQVFIVIASIATNMVANIIPATYVITMLTKIRYKFAVVISGILAMVSFPWVLVQKQDSGGLDMFVQAYSAFLGPIVVILLIEFYILRKQKVQLKELYDRSGPFKGYNPAALIAMVIGAAAAFTNVDLSWGIGFVVGGIAYLLLSKFAFKDSPFKKGTIYEKSNS